MTKSHTGTYSRNPTDQDRHPGQTKRVCDPTGHHWVQLNECSIPWGYKIEDSWTRWGRRGQRRNNSSISSCLPLANVYPKGLNSPFPSAPRPASRLCRNRHQEAGRALQHPTLPWSQRSPGQEARCCLRSWSQSTQSWLPPQRLE